MMHDCMMLLQDAHCKHMTILPGGKKIENKSFEFVLLSLNGVGGRPKCR